MGIQKLPDISTIEKEMDFLITEKQQKYGAYQKIRTKAKEMETNKRNVNQLLAVPQKEEREKNQEQG